MRNTKKLLLTIISLICFASQGFSQVWAPIATDPSGDGMNSALLDGTKLEFYYNQSQDSLWFRITVAGINTAQSNTFGVNVMLNIPGGGTTFNFWGSTNMNPYHRLVTTWVTGTPPSTYTGTIGIANSIGVNASNYTNLSSNNITINVSTGSSTIILGLKRVNLITDAEFTGSSIVCKVAAAVGSNTSWNDDIYSATGTMTLDKATGINAESPLATGIKVYPNPASTTLFIESPNANYSNAEILNTEGKVLQRFNLEAHSRLPVGNLETGIYFIRIISPTGTITRKFIKS